MRKSIFAFRNHVATENVLTNCLTMNAFAKLDGKVEIVILIQMIVQKIHAQMMEIVSI